MDSAPEDLSCLYEHKVYVSRIPTSWTTQLMKEHFASLFGVDCVAAAEIFTTRRKKTRGEGNLCYAFKNDGKCERGANCPFVHGDPSTGEDRDAPTGSGIVYFHSEEGAEKALLQRILYVSKRTVKISRFETADEGRDTSICHAWQRNNCTHGDNCKFAQEGPGATATVGAPFSGRKFQCLSFKTKGKCSKGETCPFLHVAREKKRMGEEGEGSGGKRAREEGDGKEEAGEGKVRGPCHAFQRKGACKKGDKCKFTHVEKTPA